jgi:hypothetical protein
MPDCDLVHALARVLVGEPVSTPDQVRGRLSPGHALSLKAEGLAMRAAHPLSCRGPAPAARSAQAGGVTVIENHAARTSAEVAIQLMDAGDRGERQ